MTTTRGATNGNVRGSSYDRRRRREWLLANYPADVEGFCRCYRCGRLLFNPDDHLPYPGALVPYYVKARYYWEDGERRVDLAVPLTVDRIIPGCRGGTYRRNNIRPACGPCNSETGGPLRRTTK